MDNNYVENQENIELEQATIPETDTNEPVVPDNSKPLEEITFIPTLEERLEQRRHILKPIIVLLYIFAAAIFMAGIRESIYTKEFSSFFIIAAVFVLIALLSRSGAKTNVKEEMKKGGTPIYRVFYNRIEYEYRIGDDLYAFYRVDPKKITKVKALSHIIVFIHDGVSFMIPRSAVPNDSYLLRAINVKCNDKKGNTKVRDKRQTAIIWLLACAAVIFIATLIISSLAPAAAIFFAIISFLSVGLPIVALALIAGWKSRGKGLIIAVSIILIFALLFSFGFAIEEYDNNYIGEEEMLASDILDDAYEISGVDFPNVYNVYLNEYEIYDQESKTYISYSSLNCSLTGENNEYLKSEVERRSHVWTTEMTGEMQAFVGGIYTPYGDPFMILNLTEGTYNQLPMSTYVCEYAIVSYDHSSSCVFIYVFSKAYTGSPVSTPDTLAA